MNKKGVVMLNEELTEDWANTLGECGINSLGLHSLYWHGGLDAHLNWLLDEDTQSLIEDCEKKVLQWSISFMRSIGCCLALSFRKTRNGSE